MREEAEASMREDLGSSTRESVEKSEVRNQEGPHAGTPAAAESQPEAAGELPIKDYDALHMGEISKRLRELSVEQIEHLRDYEAKNKNRRSLLTRFERRIRAARADSTTGTANEGN